MSATTLGLCVLLVANVISVNGSAIEFSSTSTSIEPLITANLTMRCSLHDTTPSVSGGLVGRKKRDVSDSSTNVADPHNTAQKRQSLTNTMENVAFVTSMVISKDGVDVATLSVHFPARSVINSPGLHVTGSLSGQPGERGFLELTWQHPTKAESGNYRCEIDTINGIGHSFDFSKTLKINEEEISLSDLVSHVQEIERDKDAMKKTEQLMSGMITLMNSTIDDLKNTINTMTNSEQLMNATIDDMKNTMKKSEQLMNATILDQKTEIISLQQQMNKTNTHVFFSAALTNGDDLHIPIDQVVIYDHVFSNVGGAYQPGTGVFTCPVSGFYTFITSVESFHDKEAYLYLQHNNNNVLTLFTVYGHGYQGNTNSAILKLDKGDTVRVVSDSDTYVYSTSGELTTTFSGHLIAVF